jgi:hypothetical protein
MMQKWIIIQPKKLLNEKGKEKCTMTDIEAHQKASKQLERVKRE